MTSETINLLIGAGIAIGTSALTQFIMYKKEIKLWENKQKAEEITWARNEQKKERDYLREIYQNSLSALASFCAVAQIESFKTYEDRKLELIDEANKWVSLLILRHPNSPLYDFLDTFLTWPERDHAERLRDRIIEVSNTELGLFLHDPISVEQEKEGTPKVREIGFIIDSEYRKAQLVEGIELYRNYSVKIKLSDLTKSQRQKLSDQYFLSHKTIPDKFELHVPTFNEAPNDSGKIVITGTKWMAKLNPNLIKPREVFDAWEGDYDAQLKKAKNQLKDSETK